MCPEAKIPRRKIKLLVVERIIGDMHLAIATNKLALRVKNDGSVVVKASSAALEERCDQTDPQIRRLL